MDKQAGRPSWRGGLRYSRNQWLPLLDDLRNWMSSEECRELAMVI